MADEAKALANEGACCCCFSGASCFFASTWSRARALAIGRGIEQHAHADLEVSFCTKQVEHVHLEAAKADKGTSGVLATNLLLFWFNNPDGGFTVDSSNEMVLSKSAGFVGVTNCSEA